MATQNVRPGGLFPNQSKGIFDAVGRGAIVERAADEFTDKPFLEKYLPHYRAANVAGYVFQAFAVLCAFTFAFSLFKSILPDFGAATVYAAAILAAGILAAVEVAKRLFFGDFIKSLVMGRGVAVGALLGNVGLIVVAVYSATIGASDFAASQADKSGAIRSEFAAKSDSLERHFAGLIDGQKDVEKGFRRSVSWRGKINMNEKNTAKILANHSVIAGNLQNERSVAVASLDAQLSAALEKNGGKTARDVSAIFWVALLVEFAGLFCIGFVFWYLSRVFIERGAAAVVALDADDGRRVAGMSGGAIAGGLADEMKRGLAEILASVQNANGGNRSPNPVIGFHRQPVETPAPPQPTATEKPGDVRTFPASMSGAVAPMPAVNLPPLQKPPGGLTAADVDKIVGKYFGGKDGGTAANLELRGFLEKYAHVVVALENGASVKSAATGCGVGETTVHNVKRCLKVLSDAVDS